MTKTPEEIKAEIEEKAAQQAKVKAELDKIRAAVNAVHEDPNVLVLLRYIASLSAIRKNPVVLLQTGDVSVSSSVYNVGRLSVYHDIQKHMSAETENLVLRREE